jgi:hypothetical protein
MVSQMQILFGGIQALNGPNGQIKLVYVYGDLVKSGERHQTTIICICSWRFQIPDVVVERI